MAPHLAARVNEGERVERFRFTHETDNFFRVPAGPGWALVGDAGYHKDPITAQGMLDAFRDAELLADTIDRGLEHDLDRALVEYQRARDAAALPIYEFTCQLAHVEQPPPPDMQALIAALAGNSAQTSRFLGIMAGSVPLAEFLSPANVGGIMAEAA
jgi:2-polyprenyl-6-methoxyphenol hydroxylase-like FAD-dependent oxidoreductase